MAEFQCKKNCGECCGPVPVTFEELKEIKENITPSQIKVLQGQKRDSMVCIFLNMNTKRCSIYEQRPFICKLYGTCDELTCGYISSTKNKAEFNRMLAEGLKRKPIGVLSANFKYDYFLK